MSQFAPKLFTEPRGEKVVQNNRWKSAPGNAWLRCSLIEQSWCEGLKCPTRARLGYARATGEWLAATGADNPCRRCKLTAGICHQFLWPESCPVSSHTNQELSRQPRLETAVNGVRPAGSFDPRADAVTPEVTAATAQTRTQPGIPAGRPRQKAAPQSGAARKGSPAAGRERTWQSSRTLLTGAVPSSGITLLQTPTQPER